MSQIQKGIFLQAIQWEMADERTGELRKGTTVRIGADGDGQFSNPTIGFDIQKFTGNFSLFDSIKSDFVGKKVDIECNIVIKGNRVKLVPIGISISKDGK